MHVNIGEAKARLSALVSAAVRGEEVILDRAGVPWAKIVALEDSNLAERKRLAAKRAGNIGYLKPLIGDIDVIVPRSMTDEEIDARERRICDSAI